MSVSVITRIIGLGNPLLGDDGVGIFVARDVLQHLLSHQLDNSQVEVIESDVAGFDLLDLLSGITHAIIVDGHFRSNGHPGAIHYSNTAVELTSARLNAVHEIDLPAVLSLGHQLGYRMASRLSIYVVEVGDIYTFTSEISIPVQQAIPKVVSMILGEIHQDWQPICPGAICAKDVALPR